MQRICRTVHRPSAFAARPMRALGAPRRRLAGGQSDRSAACDSRVWITNHPLSRASASSAETVGTICASSDTSLPSDSPKPPGSMKSRCMSMMIRAVVAGSNANGKGWAAIIGMTGASGGMRLFGGVARHVPPDDLNVRGRDRSVMNDASIAHYDDAVREFQKLIQIFADQQDRRAGIAGSQYAVVDIRHRGEIQAKDRIGHDEQ